MTNRRLILATAGLFALASTALVPTSWSADWPQWRGPNRDDVSTETGLLKTWPKDGPRLLWTFREAGAGYSGPSVVGDRLYCMGADDKSDTIFCVDVQTGKRVWSTPIAAESVLERGDGPRGSPTVDGELVYGMSGQGELACVERSTGKGKWQKSLTKDLAGSLMVPKWGYSESPLVDGDKVICTPGGKEGTMAALDKLTGAVMWRSKEVTDSCGYSSPIVAEVGGVRQYIQLTAKGVIGVDARDGKLLWRFEDSGFKVAVIPTAIFHDDYVFATSGYNAGCDLLHLVPNGSGTRAEKVYSNKNMVNHHGGVVLVGDHLYGYSDTKGWVCMEFKTGNVVWAEKKLDKGSLTCADGRLYCYGEDSGTVALVDASPAGWKEDGRFTIPEKSQIRKAGGTKFWTHPVVANGRLYLRDQDLLFCYDVNEQAAGSR